MSTAVDRAIRDARTALRTGNARAARRHLLDMLERFPTNARLMDGLADLETRISGLPARVFGPPHVKRVLQMRAAGHMAEAVEEMVALALLNPANPNARNVLGRLYIDAGSPQAALPHLTAAAKADPAFREAGVNLATALLHLGRHAEALAAVDKVLAGHPDFLPALDIRGQALIAAERADEAVGCYRRILAQRPQDREMQLSLSQALTLADQPQEAAELLEGIITAQPGNFRARNNLGNIRLAEGRLDEAERHFRAAIAASPQSGNAYYNLSRTITFRAEDPAIPAMKALSERTDLAPDERISLMFALSKALENTGETDASFAALAEANRAKRATLDYTLDQDRALLDRLATTFAAAAPGLDPAGLPPAPVIPIFVLGMMRSGTTLTEQIVSAHSQVHGAGELRFLGAAVAPELETSDGPLDRAALERVRERYLAELAALAKGAPYAVDKLPLNFRYIGLIRKALPEAKILHLNRDPVAVCWSHYKTYFNGQSIGYAWDLTEVGSFYRLYEAFMDRMRRDYPGGFLDVDYKALTETPEPVIRAMLDYCGLPFEEACLSPEKNKRRVRTASVTQVRSGIYTGSTSKWRGFERHMGPLLEALQQPATSF
jgi:tetratricopeptide (TPR) repeat protein